MQNILNNYTVTDDEWEIISFCFPTLPEPSGKGGRPWISNRLVFQAMLYWLADGLPKQRVKLYTGIGYDTLAGRLDEWIEAGVFLGIWQMALENYDELCGIRDQLLLLDRSINIALNGGEKTGPNPTDRGRSGSKRTPLTDACGTPLGIVTGAANSHDTKFVEQTLDSSLVPLPEGATLELDRGYRGPATAEIVAKKGLKLHIPGKDRLERRLAARKRRPIECTHQKFNCWHGIKVRVLRLDRRWDALVDLAAAFVVFRATSCRIATST